MNLEEFKKKFKEIEKKGFVKSTRKGPTGIGHTIETLLGLKENNLILPDMGSIELKAHRDGSNSLITLFTFNKKAWKMRPLDAIRKFGCYDKNNRLGMYYTLSLEPNSAGVFITVNKKELLIQHISGVEIASWKLSDITKRFLQKIPALLFVSAHTDKQDGDEHFHFYKAQLMRGTSSKRLLKLFSSGDLLVDLRLYDKGTRARNHGTGFRVSEKNLPLLFDNIEEI